MKRQTDSTKHTKSLRNIFCFITLRILPLATALLASGCAASDDYALFEAFPMSADPASPWSDPDDETFTPFQFAPVCAPCCCLFPLRASVFGIGIGAILSPLNLYGVGLAGGTFAGSHAGVLASAILVSDSGYGVTLSIASNQTRNYGLAIGILNMVRENFGAMIGIVNKNDDVLYPLVSDAADDPTESAFNIQIGLFNSCHHGLQIGLLNYNSRALIPWMPIFNFSLFQSRKLHDGDEAATP